MSVHTEPGPWDTQPPDECPQQFADERDVDMETILDALADLRAACTDAYKAGRIAAEPFVHAGNVLAAFDKQPTPAKEPAP